MMNVDVFAQAGFRCRLEWGQRGARHAAARGDVLVIVDTLSFSSAVSTAIHYGGLVYPCAPDEDAAALAWQLGAEAAVARSAVPQQGRFSLSPQTYVGLQPGTRIVLASVNGAACSRYAQAVPHLLAGALLNAAAVAAAVSQLLANSQLAVTVLACGERWDQPAAEGQLRPALEDYLGAGAILSALSEQRSPEAEVCAAAFAAVQERLPQLLWECGSGRELRQKGYAGDVEHAAQLNCYDSVPIMPPGPAQWRCFVPWRPGHTPMSLTTAS